jgi:DivIVA domain-containing protein
MSDSSGSPLIPSRDARLTPESVSERSFSQVKRGYSETEVRAFLRLVADELASVSGHERDLANRVRSLEERLAAPKPVPSDQDLIVALGEETARVLGQARESAIELRTKADEHARRVVREAQESARELRSTTQQAVETKAREAEDAARARAKEIVGEARTLRERVLTDLAERRQDLERQIAELRSGRGRLVETYQAVERALSQAARVMADEPATSAGSAPLAPPVDAHDSAPPGDVTAPGASPEPPAPSTPAESTPAPSTPAESAPAAESSESDAPATPDVGALFEQLRSVQDPSTAAAPPVAEPPAAEPPAAEPPAAEVDATAAATVAAGADATAEGADGATDGAADETADDADAADAAEEVVLDANQLLVKDRDDVLAPAAVDLARRAKRALQDEQNDVLDGLRRQRGKIDTTKILPPPDEQLAKWAHVLQPAADRAYAAGAASVTGSATGSDKKDGGSVPGAVLGELTGAAVTPLRDRLESSLESIDARSPADMEIAVAQALGARYREWRTQDLDVVLGDALAMAYSRGVYDAAPAGARLRWIPAREGKCPDCDDNALEPTARGEAFPTGQLLPPAHPGCRCLLVVEPSE